MYSAVKLLHSRAVSALSDVDAILYIAPPEETDAAAASPVSVPQDQAVGQVTAAMQNTQVRCRH